MPTRSQAPCSLSEIVDWLEAEYNDALSVYQWEDRVRLTNGSAAYYVDISVHMDGHLELTGERYGEVIRKSCLASRDHLIGTLARTI